MKLDLKEIFTLIDKVEEVKLDSFEYQDRDMKVKIHGSKNPFKGMEGEKCGEPEFREEILSSKENKKESSSKKEINTKNDEIMEKSSNGTEKEQYITSPMVGTFYQAPSEEESPFVAVGDTVKKGQVIGIVEAMKLMNEITSEVEGVVTEILVENGTLVEFAQPLIRVQVKE